MLLSELLMEIKEIIVRVLGCAVYNKPYHSELPRQFAPWHVYTLSHGHSILCLIQGHYDMNRKPLWLDLVPVPVKTLLRSVVFDEASGVNFYRGLKAEECETPYIIADVEYNDREGVIVEVGDWEM